MSATVGFPGGLNVSAQIYKSYRLALVAGAHEKVMGLDKLIALSSGSILLTSPGGVGSSTFTVILSRNVHPSGVTMDTEYVVVSLGDTNILCVVSAVDQRYVFP